MDRKKGGQSCLIGFALLVVAHWTGSFAWIARLLGYIGIANGTAALQQDGDRWMYWANRFSTAAVGVFAVLQILTLTGILTMQNTVWLCMEYAFSLCCAGNILLSLLNRKKEEHK